VRGLLEGVLERRLKLQERPGGEDEVLPLPAHPVEGAVEIGHDVLEVPARLDFPPPVDLREEVLEARLLDAVDGELGRPRQDRQGAKRGNDVDRVELILEDQAPLPASMAGDVQPVGSTGLPGREVQVRAPSEPVPEMIHAERLEHLERKTGRRALDRARAEGLPPQRANEVGDGSSDDRWQHRSRVSVLSLTRALLISSR
jgi:hypothetical protein